MLKFLASVLDQMDLALEHIQKGGVHDARFGLMLTDNAIELAMHELAKNKHSELKASWIQRERYQHTKELDEAMGRVFEAKLKFAKLEGLLTEEQARTVAIMHNFRNELYHVGLQHEAILPALSRFYFSTACTVLGAYRIRYFSYWHGLELRRDRRSILPAAATTPPPSRMISRRPAARWTRSATIRSPTRSGRLLTTWSRSSMTKTPISILWPRVSMSVSDELEIRQQSSARRGR